MLFTFLLSSLFSNALGLYAHLVKVLTVDGGKI